MSREVNHMPWGLTSPESWVPRPDPNAGPECPRKVHTVRCRSIKCELLQVNLSAREGTHSPGEEKAWTEVPHQSEVFVSGIGPARGLTSSLDTGGVSHRGRKSSRKPEPGRERRVGERPGPVGADSAGLLESRAALGGHPIHPTAQPTSGHPLHHPASCEPLEQAVVEPPPLHPQSGPDELSCRASGLGTPGLQACPQSTPSTGAALELPEATSRRIAFSPPTSRAPRHPRRKRPHHPGSLQP